MQPKLKFVNSFILFLPIDYYILVSAARTSFHGGRRSFLSGANAQSGVIWDHYSASVYILIIIIVLKVGEYRRHADTVGTLRLFPRHVLYLQLKFVGELQLLKLVGSAVL